MAESQYNGYVLVYGGSGALGSGCVSQFKAANWWVASVEQWKPSKEPKEYKEEKDACVQVLADHRTAPNQNPNREANVNILVHTDKHLKEQEVDIIHCLGELLMGSKLDAIICVAGGYLGGNINSEFVESCERMWQQNIWPSILAACIARHFLKPDGMLCFTGARAALQPTPGSLAYGLCKSSIHQLTKSLAASGSGMPKDSLCIALLPITLDTVMNRQTMPNGDISGWTPTKYITDLIFKWSIRQNRPKNGSLIQFVTQNFNTDITIV